MYDQSTTIETFLAAAAAKQPVPGGGSIAALAGALSASMGEMVINYSLGKKSLEQFSSQLKSALGEFTRARQLLLGLMVEDQAAYMALSEARKLAAGTPERNAAFAPALLACIRVPQAIGATALAVLEICDRIIDCVNIHLLSDLAVCADLAMATLRCATYNVRVNLADVTDPAERANLQAACAKELSRGLALIQRVSPRIWQRYDQPK